MPTYLVTEKQVWWTWYTVEAKSKKEVRANYHKAGWPDEDGSEGEHFEIVEITLKEKP